MSKILTRQAAVLIAIASSTLFCSALSAIPRSPLSSWKNSLDRRYRIDTFTQGMANQLQSAPSRARSQVVPRAQMQNNPSNSITRIPKFVRTLNSSTKWLVTLGNTIGVWSRPHTYYGPYIIVGAIAAVYLTEVLKKLINQSRPENSLLLGLTDPGMPSGHSLVTFFAAVGWINSLGSYGNALGKAAIIAVAASVAILRVVCGYHTIAQIAVGAALGSALGQGWILLGNMFQLSNPQALFVGAWVAYSAGSVLFIATNMSTWASKDRHV